MPRKKDKKPVKIDKYRDPDTGTYTVYKTEAFFALPEPSAELQAKTATERHLRWFRETSQAFELLLVKINQDKPRRILRYLYGNANATVDQLRSDIEGEPLFPDALRKMIERLNDEFLDAGLPLIIEKERGGTGGERLWLNIQG